MMSLKSDRFLLLAYSWHFINWNSLKVINLKWDIWFRINNYRHYPPTAWNQKSRQTIWKVVFRCWTQIAQDGSKKGETNMVSPPAPQLTEGHMSKPQWEGKQHPAGPLRAADRVLEEAKMARICRAEQWRGRKSRDLYKALLHLLTEYLAAHRWAKNLRDWTKTPESSSWTIPSIPIRLRIICFPTIQAGKTSLCISIT